MADSFQFEGMTIHVEPTFDYLDDPKWKDRMVMVTPAAARAIEEAQSKLGRRLTADEVISCLIHEDCIAALDLT